MREELEEILKQQEQNHSRTINALRKHLLRHVQDMQTWKVYLERDREYEGENLALITEEECAKLPFTKQVDELDIVIVADNARLEKLLREREIEAAEVVSVNIGKKKKRIKKNDPLIDKIDMSKLTQKKTFPGASIKSARGLGSARPNFVQPKKTKKWTSHFVFG